jgi:NAD(P)H-hydrate epimerase
MIKIVTAKEIREIDRVTIKKYGVPGMVLMERAGLAVVSKINEIYSDKKVVVLCGGGNNGGDGFVIARILHNQGREVKLFIASNPRDLKGDAKMNYNAAKKYGVKIFPINKFMTLSTKSFNRNSLIIDALLGTGLSKDVRSPVSGVINRINKLSSPVISVDIPSGISSDTGQIMGCAVKARHTITFGLPKRGHLLYPGAEHSGELFIEDIGFHQKLLQSDKIKLNLIRKQDAVRLLLSRPKYSHKGTYGHVLLLAGSRGKTGAALMASKACLRAGAGLVTIGIPETLVDTLQSRVTEEMILPLADKGDGTLSFDSSDAILEFMNKKGNVLAIGPGLSVDGEISKLVRLLILKSKVPLVIDADGLNAIAGQTSILKKSKSPVILTPHTGEMARLLIRNTEQTAKVADGKRQSIEEDRIETAVSFARRTKTCLVLKGVPTVIAEPDGNAFVNSSGNPGMSTAGAGDVLTGMISAFLAQKLSPEDASVLAVFVHGRIGDVEAEKMGQKSLIASDIIKAIPKVFNSLRKQ